MTDINGYRTHLDEEMRPAKAIIDEDHSVDALHSQLYNEVPAGFVEDPGYSIGRANYVLWAGHNLERVADRVTNICERVIFVATGKMGEISTHYTTYTYQVSDA